MELRYTLGEADVVALVRLRWQVLPQGRRRLRRIRMTYMLSFAALAVGDWLVAQDEWVTAAFLALAVVVPLLYPFIYNFRGDRAAKAAYRSAAAEEGRDGESPLAHTLRIAEDGLVESAFAGEARTRWLLVDGQITTPTHAFINVYSMLSTAPYLRWASCKSSLT